MHRLRNHLHILLAALFLAPGGLSACGGPQEQTVVIVASQDRAPRLEFDGLRLLMTESEAKAWADGQHFGNTIATAGAANQTAAIQPRDHAVRGFELKFEAGALISLTADYAAPDPKRAEVRKHYALKRLRPDGGWVMADGARQTLVMLNRDGTRLVAVHAGKARDRAAVEAMFELLLKEKPTERGAVPETDPKAGDAHL